jgi:hypothetical protein
MDDAAGIVNWAPLFTLIVAPSELALKIVTVGPGMARVLGWRGLNAADRSLDLGRAGR